MKGCGDEGARGREGEGVEGASGREGCGVERGRGGRGSRGATAAERWALGDECEGEAAMRGSRGESRGRRTGIPFKGTQGRGSHEGLNDGGCTLCRLCAGNIPTRPQNDITPIHQGNLNCTTRQLWRKATKKGL